MVLSTGWIAEEVALEFPDLQVVWVRGISCNVASRDFLDDQLRDLSDRVRGPQTIAMRQSPIGQAFRAFYRQIGLDPDTDRPPAEQAAVKRLIAGGFHPASPIEDALLVAVVETQVPVWAIDDGGVTGELGIRTAQRNEPLGASQAKQIPEGTLVVADDRVVVAELFGRVAPDYQPQSETAKVCLFSIQAPGVPYIHVDEALRTAATILQKS
jgi:DNA/RNA-binding domain of Phe-tRNA-synthetase-like protein